MRDVLTLDRLRSMDPDAAAALLAYRRADGAAELDAKVLADWLQLDPANRAAWESVQNALSDFDDVEDDEILAALRAHARRAGPERPRWTRNAAAAAAVAVLALGGVLGITLQWSDDGRGARGPVEAPAPAEAAQAYAAGKETSESFQLADGTRMILGSDSAASVTLAAARRDVRLVRGRAFFDVAPDARRPFAVRAADQEIVALGTKFDVRVQPGEMRVALVEGRVAVRPVRPGAKPTLLQPGEMLVAREGEAPRVSPADPEEALRFDEVVVVFDNVTLAEAAQELNRRGAGRLIVRDPAVAGLRISGRFRAGDLPRFGRSLALLHPVRLVRRGPAEWEIVPVR